MFFSDCVVLKLCLAFHYLITLAKQVIVFDFHNTTLKLTTQDFVSQATTQGICCLLC